MESAEFETFLLETARQVEEWLNDTPAYLERFQYQIRIFHQKFDAYYKWLRSQRDAAGKNPSFRDYSQGKPPKEGYIWDGIEGYWRQPDREEIPHVTNWLPPNSYRFRADGFSQQKRLQAKGIRRPDDKERLLCYYVLLAVVHDILLKDLCYNIIYFDMGKEDVGLDIGMWAHNTLWDYVQKPPENEEPQTRSLIVAAVDGVKKDLQEWCIEAAEKPAEMAADYTFKWTGDHWVVAFRGDPKTIIHMKGMAYIAELLANPGKAFDPAVLCVAGTEQERAAPVTGASTQEMTDSEARQDYKKEREDLQGDLAEARKDNDLARISQIQGDLEAIEQDRSRTTRLGGRVRQFPYEGQRPREATAKAMRRAIRHIGKHHQRLWLHLHNCIDISSLRYIPDTEIDWDL